LKKLNVGCGGWSYWQVDREYRSSDDQLADYATVFNFVEVNNTYYQVPQLEEVRSWRARVPQDFQFAVKCNRQISHQNPLVPTENHFQLMEKMEKICKTLSAVALVIQTPPRFTPENLQTVDVFFSHYTDFSCDLVWEPRGPTWNEGPTKEKLHTILNTYNITHCTDISRGMPLHSANVSYTRVFGLGVKNQWEFDDSEIKILHARASELSTNRNTYVTFHTQRQTADAARLKAFDETGRLINTTGKYEVNSMLVAIDEYRKYPITKKELLAAHGWKIIDLKNDKRIRAQELLKKLPDIDFKTKKELKLQIEKIFRGGGQKKLDELKS